MEPSQAIVGLVESLLSLSVRLRSALDQEQNGLVATLLAERQGLLLALGQALQAGIPLSEEQGEHLKAADKELREAVVSVRDGLGREISALQRHEKAAVSYHTTAPASYFDYRG